MELIKEIESRRNKRGQLVKWGLFLCPFCDNIIWIKQAVDYIERRPLL